MRATWPLRQLGGARARDLLVAVRSTRRALELLFYGFRYYDINRRYRACARRPSLRGKQGRDKSQERERVNLCQKENPLHSPLFTTQQSLQYYLV